MYVRPTEAAGLSGERMLQGGAGSFSYGFQLFPSSEKKKDIPNSIFSRSAANVEESSGMSYGHG